MGSTGIVRRIDELGRIVIPKELRRTMRISVGDEMEITVSGDDITLKKYSVFESALSAVKSVVKLLTVETGADAVLVDTSKVVVSEGVDKKKYGGALVGGELLKAVRDRKPIILHGDSLAGVFENVKCDSNYLVFEPIVSQGDGYGGIVLLLKTLPGDVSRAYLKFCAQMISECIR